MSVQQPGPTRFCVGLTGGIGSGKTRVANAFAELGAAIVDTDQIARHLTAPGGAAIESLAFAFGPDAIGADGALDRARMRALVFANPDQKARLEAILHPLIRTEAYRQIEGAQAPYVMVVVPLLAETGQWRFPRTLVVDCSEELQLARVMQRDGLDESMVRSIIAQQASRQQRLNLASDVLENQGDFTACLPEIARLHQIYCAQALAN